MSYRNQRLNRSRGINLGFAAKVTKAAFYVTFIVMVLGIANAAGVISFNPLLWLAQF